MYRSLALLALVGCYDDPVIVIHVTRDSPDLDGDLQACNAGGGCDPSPYLEGEARIFGSSKELKRDVSIFDDHGGAVTIRYHDAISTLEMCFDIALTGHEVVRNMGLQPSKVTWDGPETFDTGCGPQ